MSENTFDQEFPKYENLSQKIFSDLVCKQCESSQIVQFDAMGREIFWEDLGRP